MFSPDLTEHKASLQDHPVTAGKPTEPRFDTHRKGGSNSCRRRRGPWTPSARDRPQAGGLTWTRLLGKRPQPGPLLPLCFPSLLSLDSPSPPARGSQGVFPTLMNSQARLCLPRHQIRKKTRLQRRGGGAVSLPEADASQREF